MLVDEHHHMPSLAHGRRRPTLQLPVVRVPPPCRRVAGIDLREEEPRGGINAEHDLRALRLPLRPKPRPGHPQAMERAAMVGPRRMDAAAPSGLAVPAPLP